MIDFRRRGDAPKAGLLGKSPAMAEKNLRIGRVSGRIRDRPTGISIMAFSPKHIPVWARLVLSQGLAFLAVVAAANTFGIGSVPLWLATGALASVIGLVSGLSPYWITLQMFLPFAAAYSGAVPAWAYLALFVLSALVYWNSASEQVPLYLTNVRTWNTVSGLAREWRARSFVDLGSGLGGGVIQLARENPGLRVKGVETAPLVFLASRIRLALAPCRNAEIRYRSIWDEDLSAYDVVYCFLSPVPMERMFAKAKREMRANAHFISNSFEVAGQTPDRTVEVGDGRKTRLLIWRM